MLLKTCSFLVHVNVLPLFFPLNNRQLDVLLLNVSAFSKDDFDLMLT